MMKISDFNSIFFFFLLLHSLSSLPRAKSTQPMNCSDAGRLCTSFLALKPTSNMTLPLIQSMFDVLPKDINVENTNKDFIFVRKNCSCDPRLRNYLTTTTFTVRNGSGFVYDLVRDSYQGLAFLPVSNNSRTARIGEVVSVRLFCGCSSGLWNYLMSYVMRDEDTIASLASRFGVSMDSIEQVNGIADPENITVGGLYYIPLNSVPGDPYPVEVSIPPAPEPAPSINNITEISTNHKRHVPYGWIVGGLAVGIAVVVVLALLLFIVLRQSLCSGDGQEGNAKDHSGRNAHKFQILRNTSFCCASGRFCSSSDEWKQSAVEENNQHHPANVPKAIGNDAFEVEKPAIFTYEDILAATEGFSESNLLGHGTYGSVYYGQLRDQEVAIKRMTATKSKEFMAEMKILSKVHHTNLVELLGYTATDDELFVIYEYAQKGSLKNHLHDSHNKGHTSLSWIMRVQIALDAARGLEYIHEHTKAHYVHRDIKSSNILLDGSFRAKISDFGLSKLVGTTGDGEASATRVVGTYGYLAPEYLSNGLATTKSDVYAFGVVLFELISGKEAVIRTEGMPKGPERRSLVSIMLAVLRHVPDSTSMPNFRDYIDPNLMDLYPHDCVYKVAMLAKQCVDDDPILRPDMKQAVISLSQILLSSVEWEATLAGNSQVFSGLVQGR
ncbi:lysM domain receptor-like kinase 3 isoform X2 [Amaranthus tricolor]|uniref:lysM domain receptor-like kinase 3 isoform X2 n=1 Tax=Amaranthus tricolor TaxID=29722 RepID=UPI00258CDD7B|nr:lysM domain receptor-like kinase 3 isoform X2 [Amaranthus tricolor]